MSDVRFRDQNLGAMILCFDGRIVEVFSTRQSTAVRFHVGMLVLEVGEPDQKGRTRVDLAPVKPGHNGVRLILDDSDRLLVEPLLDEIRLALTGITGPSPHPHT